MSTVNAQKENFEFDVDVNQLMDVIIKSVYSSSEIFLRELVSNSSDACDKFVSLYQDFVDKNIPVHPINALEIVIKLSSENKTLTVFDNGIGMKKVDLINFIGTIANSGTRKFKEAMATNDGSGKDIGHLIGQFGLGFYSSYLVAERVDIITKHPEDEAFVWSSCGKDTYTIEPYNGEPFLHGTFVVLHLKEGNEEYLEVEKIKAIGKKYSSFLRYPTSINFEKEVEDKGDEVEKGDEEKKDETTEPVVEEIVEKKMKKVAEKVRINVDRPLWERNLKDVPEDELKSFYKSVSGDWDDYLAVESWTIQGILELKLLLFIPKRSRMDMFSRKNKKQKNIKLYCNNVFVTDDFDEVIPEWMNFVVGIVSSNDIAMNVSRELIQGTNVMKLVKKTLPGKALDLIISLSNDAEKYDMFYREFGNFLKLAVTECQDTQQEKFASCLRYYTSKSGDKQITLKQYVQNMPENQKQIYVLTGLTKEQVTNSPFLEAFKNYEVIFMYDAMDEFMLRSLKNYQGKPIQAITSEGVEIPEMAEMSEELKAEYDNLANRVKEILGNEVEKVSINVNLGSVPCVISTTKYSNSSVMENIMTSQVVAEKNPFAASAAISKKIFELNPNNPIIKSMKELMDDGSQEEKLKDLVDLTYYTMLINCGFVMRDSSKYCQLVYKFLSVYNK